MAPDDAGEIMLVRNDGRVVYREKETTNSMRTTVETTMVVRGNVFVGWRVYLDGTKYPKPPMILYGPIPEDEAIRLAFVEAGLDPDTAGNIFAEG